MDNPLDFIHLLFLEFWRILKMDYPSSVWKRPLVTQEAYSSEFLLRVCFPILQILILFHMHSRFQKWLVEVVLCLQNHTKFTWSQHIA